MSRDPRKARWLRVAGVFVAIGVSGLLAGCVAQPHTTSATTPSPTSSAVAIDLRPAQPAVPPPASELEAFAAANKTVDDDLATVFLVLQRKIPAEAYDKFESGAYRTAMGNSINDDFESTIQVGSETYSLDVVAGEVPLWIPNLATSSSSTLEVEGRSFPYGIVQVTGCFQDRQIFRYTDLVQPGSPTPTPAPTPVLGTLADQLVRTKVTVTYQPSSSVWLITDETVLPDHYTGSLCPPG
jgi:hypothetical protein